MLAFVVIHHSFCSLNESKTFFHLVFSATVSHLLISLFFFVNPCVSYSAVMQVQLKAPDSQVAAAHVAYKVSLPVHNPFVSLTLTFGTISSCTQYDFAASHAPGSSITSSQHDADVEM